MDVEIYHPAYLRERKVAELNSLTAEQVKVLSERYPFMNPDLRIRRKGDHKSPVSPATWKSFYNLLRAGHPFELVGTKYGEPKETIEQVVASVQDMAVPEFVSPDKPIIGPAPARRGRPKGSKNRF